VKLAKAGLVPTAANLLGEYGSFAELEAACAAFCEQVNARPHRATRRASAEMLAEERAQLHPVPAVPFTAALGVTRRADAMSLVAFEGGQYSVPHQLAGEGAPREADGHGEEEAGRGHRRPHQGRVPDRTWRPDGRPGRRAGAGGGRGVRRLRQPGSAGGSVPPATWPSSPTCMTRGSSATPTTSGAGRRSCTRRQPDPRGSQPAPGDGEGGSAVFAVADPPTVLGWRWKRDHPAWGGATMG